jgi:hypothetical protein
MALEEEIRTSDAEEQDEHKRGHQDMVQAGLVELAQAKEESHRCILCFVVVFIIIRSLHTNAYASNNSSVRACNTYVVGKQSLAKILHHNNL